MGSSSVAAPQELKRSPVVMDTGIQDLDDLFGSLKAVMRSGANSNGAAAAAEHPVGMHHSNDLDKDILKISDDDDNDLDGKVARQQAIFHSIEKKLHQLPKLKNTFDDLSRDSSSKTLPPANLHEPTAPPSTKPWFQLPKQELTDSLKRDLALIKHRAALDPKRHYKKEKWQIPERFSVGTIVEGTGEFFSSRIKNKNRTNTILASLMADTDTDRYFRRKYSEIQEKKTAGKRAHYKHVREKRRKL
ncbi:Fcf2p Ecym_1457 [Eremothecium cymbalariae DBVPG|uniref:Fcf2 pre-rRNA processing C-terminal domain-containing protein n=1 Tax=Eremothecium cymbalariae (strain CBS 270.75 / DBVPG 7215 / KCTC 17166 / NRRL Y-17582) TaxID=931890 RepID=G8JMG6_ERECY|nr:hypothetical protein Ecym_1457 [Eremothecium cymbalariae DBVPG\